MWKILSLLSFCSLDVFILSFENPRISTIHLIRSAFLDSSGRLISIQCSVVNKVVNFIIKTLLSNLVKSQGDKTFNYSFEFPQFSL